MVAGVPSLADFDVSIDAGGDASDPENAVPFSIRTPEGKTYKQPGNFNYLIETSLFGTEPKFAAKGVRPDLDGDGRVEFGEALPDADFYVAAARDFETHRERARRRRAKWEPTLAGRAHRARRDDADDVRVLRGVEEQPLRRRRAARPRRRSWSPHACRTSPTSSPGLVLIYDNVQPQVAKADAEQARQTEASLRRLHRLRRAAARRGARRAALHRRRTPTRSAPTRRTRPRRSPARSPRPPAG